MSKAKTIDRLALTRRKFGKPKDEAPVMEDVTPYEDISGYVEPDISGDVCPMCGQHTLIHESGCVKCQSCMWSACG